MSYALIALTVGAVYAAAILAIGSIVGSRSDLAVAASTLAAVAVVNPAPRRIQNAADHRFNRSRYDARRELEAFAQHLRGQVELAAVSDDLLRVVDRTLQRLSRCGSATRADHRLTSVATRLVSDPSAARP